MVLVRSKGGKPRDQPQGLGQPAQAVLAQIQHYELAQVDAKVLGQRFCRKS